MHFKRMLKVRKHQDWLSGDEPLELLEGGFLLCFPSLLHHLFQLVRQGSNCSGVSLDKTPVKVSYFEE